MTARPKTSTRRINLLVIHSTATPEGRHHTIEDITEWHKKRGFRSIGYHYVIYIDGSIHEGRNINTAGAHLKGHNANSIGVAYVGGTDNRLRPKDTRNDAQMKALETIVKEIITIYPNIEIAGHSQFSQTACPSFDVPSWLRSININNNIFVV